MRTFFLDRRPFFWAIVETSNKSNFLFMLMFLKIRNLIFFYRILLVFFILKMHAILFNNSFFEFVNSLFFKLKMIGLIQYCLLMGFIEEL